MSFLATPPFNIDSYEISVVSSLACRCNISALDAFRTDQKLREWFSRSNILNRAHTSEKEIFLRQVVMCAKFRTTLRSHRKHGHDSLLYNNDVLQLLEQSPEFRQKCKNDPTIFNSPKVCTTYFTSEQSSSVCAQPDVKPQPDPRMTISRAVSDSKLSPVVCSRDGTTTSPDPTVNAPATHPALAASATSLSMPVIPAHRTTSPISYNNHAN